MMSRDDRILTHMVRAGLFDASSFSPEPPSVPGIPEITVCRSYSGPVKRYGCYELPVFSMKWILRGGF